MRRWICLCTLLMSTISLAAIQWTDPVLLTELNDPATGQRAEYPNLSRDGSTLYFGRRDAAGIRQLYTATRDETGLFSDVTQITELAINRNLYTPWVSDDGLRLYYGIYVGGSTGIVLNMATRPDLSTPWSHELTFSSMHAFDSIDAHPSLVPDELTIFYSSDRGSSSNDTSIWMATRSSIDAQFSNPLKLTELEFGDLVAAPCIMPDGLTIYFVGMDNGQYDLFRATRSSSAEPFTNIEPLTLNTTAIESTPYVTPDESEIFFESNGGIWYAQRDPLDQTIAQVQTAIEQDQDAAAKIEASLQVKYQTLDQLNALLDSLDAYPEMSRPELLKSLAALKNAINVEENSLKDLQNSIETLQSILDLLTPVTE